MKRYSNNLRNSNTDKFIIHLRVKLCLWEVILNYRTRSFVQESRDCFKRFATRTHLHSPLCGLYSFAYDCFAASRWRPLQGHSIRNSQRPLRDICSFKPRPLHGLVNIDGAIVTRTSLPFNCRCEKIRKFKFIILLVNWEFLVFKSD